MGASTSSSPPPPPPPPLTFSELRRIRVLDLSHGPCLGSSSSSILLDIPSPIPVSQFLHDKNPNLLLCDSDSIRPGKRPCPLRHHARLAHGHLYVLLPLPAFQRRITPSQADALSLLLLHGSQKEKHMPAQRQQQQQKEPVQRNAAGEEQRKKMKRKGRSTMMVMVMALKKRRSNQILPESPIEAAPDAAIPIPSISTLNTYSTSYTNIVCDAGADSVSRYIEQLISRSNSWRPCLDAIQETT